MALMLALGITIQSFIIIGLLVFALGTIYVWWKNRKEKNAKGAFERSRARYTSDFIDSQTKYYVVTSVSMLILSLVDFVTVLDPINYKKPTRLAINHLVDVFFWLPF